MAGKTNSRSWSDIQITIVAVALVFTLVLWNSFASPDRVKAEEKANTAQQQASTDPLPEATPYVALTPTPLPQVVIMFADPTTPTPTPSSSTQQTRNNRNGGGGGRSGGGGGGGGTGGGGGGGGGGTGGS